MNPHGETEKADGHRRSRHEAVPEDHLARKDRNDLRNDAKSRQNQDVDLGVAEEPKVVLPQQSRAAGGRREEMGVELAIHEEHHQRGVQGGQGHDDEKGVDEDHPDEQRQSRISRSEYAKCGSGILTRTRRACSAFRLLATRANMPVAAGGSDRASGYLLCHDPNCELVVGLIPGAAGRRRGHRSAMYGPCGGDRSEARDNRGGRPSR